MKSFQCVKGISAVLLLASALFVFPAAAQVPVADGQSSKNTLKDFMQRVKESKVVTDTIAFANKTSAAVGDAKRSVTEYVIKNKEKLEKKLEKVEKYKKQVEKYKKEYEEYKKWADENIQAAMEFKADVESGIQQAQDFKAQVEDGIETAKDLKDSAGGMIDSAKGMAQDKLGAVTNTVDGYAAQAGVDTNLSASRGASASGSANASAPVPSSGGAAVRNVTAPAVSQAVSTRRAFVPAGSAVQNNLAGSAGAVNIPAAAISDVVAPAVSAVQAAPVVNGAVSAVSDPLPANIGTIGTETAVSPDQPQTLPLINPGEDLPVDTISGAADAAGPVVAGAAQTGVTGAAKPVAVSSSAAAQISGKAAAVRSAAGNMVGKSGAVLPLKTKDLTRSEKTTPVQMQNRAVSAERKTKRIPARRSFKKIEQISSLWQPELRALAVTGGSLPIASAFALKLPDGGTDVNGTVIVPSSISMTCGRLSSDDAKKEGVMDDCLVRQINDKTKGAQVDQAQNMTATYLQGKKEYAAAYMAEGYKAQIDVEKTVDDILPTLETAESTSTTDDYANVVEMNKAVATAMNGLLNIYSSRLALQTYVNYGDYRFVSEDDKKGGS